MGNWQVSCRAKIPSTECSVTGAHLKSKSVQPASLLGASDSGLFGWIQNGLPCFCLSVPLQVCSHTQCIMRTQNNMDVVFAKGQAQFQVYSMGQELLLHPFFRSGSSNRDSDSAPQLVLYDQIVHTTASTQK